MINNIQILRAFAAINVIFFHVIAVGASYSQGPSFFRFLTGWGANGVDIFFVISGFLMLHTQMRKQKTPLAFLKDRLIRIVPIYWALTFFILAVSLIAPSLFREMVITPVWVASSLLFTSYVIGGHMPVVHIGWTLEWEMFFYLVFATSLLFKSRRSQIAFAVFAVAALSVATQNWIVLEFLFGMLAAYLYHKGALSRTSGLVVFLLGALLLALSLLPAVRALSLERTLIWGIPSFFIVLGVLFSAALKGRTLSYLGNASYSIYLVQILTIPAFYKFSTKLLGGWNGDILAMLCLTTSVASGCLVYALIEKPLTGWLRNLTQFQSRDRAAGQILTSGA